MHNACGVHKNVQPAVRGLSKVLHNKNNIILVPSLSMTQLRALPLPTTRAYRRPLVDCANPYYPTQNLLVMFLFYFFFFVIVLLKLI